MAAVIMAVAPAPTLQRLLIRVPGISSVSSHALARAQLLRGLTSLQCNGIRAPVRTQDLDSLCMGLPALQHLALHVAGGDPHTNGAPVVCRMPPALSRCTRLTCLSISASAHLGRVFDWDGLLPDVVTALGRLETLRLRNGLTQPVTDRITALSSLTELGLCCELPQPNDNTAALVPEPLPLAVSQLTGLRCLDVMATVFPFAIMYLTGLEVLTLRSPLVADEEGEMALASDQLRSLSRLQRLSRLQLNDCWVDDGEALEGLGACTALRDLRVLHCCLAELPQLPCFRGLTQLSVADNILDHEGIRLALRAMPKLRVLDISRNHHLPLEPKLLLGMVSCGARLHDVYIAEIEFQGYSDDAVLGEALLEVQRQVPHVRLHMRGAPSYGFGIL